MFGELPNPPDVTSGGRSATGNVVTPLSANEAKENKSNTANKVVVNICLSVMWFMCKLFV